MNYVIVVTEERAYTFYSRSGKDLELKDIELRWDRAYGNGSFQNDVKAVTIHEGMHQEWEQE